MTYQQATIALIIINLVITAATLGCVVAFVIDRRR